MKVRKIKFRNLSILWNVVYRKKKSAPFWVLLSMLINTVFPISELWLLAKVIELTTSNSSLDTFFTELVKNGSIVVILAILSTILDIYIGILSEQIRLEGLQEVLDLQLTKDFPLIQGKQAHQEYHQASRLFDHAQTTLGRVLREWQSFLYALTASLLYVGILSQLEGLIVVLVCILLVGYLFCEIRYIEVRNQHFSELTQNDHRFDTLRNMIGDNRLAKDIRLYSMHGWLALIYRHLQARQQAIKKPINRIQLQRDLFAVFAIVGLTAITYWRSFQLLEQGTLAVSSFVMYVGLASLVATTLMEFAHQAARIIISLDEVEVYRHYFNQPAIFPKKSAVELPTNIQSIVFKDISYTYPGQDEPTISHFSACFEQGEKIAIVGLNGAGKTTLMKLMMGLLVPDSGEILVNGLKSSLFSATDYYHLFAPLFQDTQLMTFTIEETILQGQPREEERYQKVLQQTGMKELIAQYEAGDQTKIIREIFPDAVSLSGGQLQRLKLAQALYKNAPVLIFDEPTAALDPLAECEIYHHYQQFADGKISFFISHRLASTHFCSRVLYMEQGSLLEEGTHQALMQQKGKYYQLFETQAQYYKEDDNDEECTH